MITSHYNYGCTIEVNSLIFMISINSADELATKLVTVALLPLLPRRGTSTSASLRVQAPKYYAFHDEEDTAQAYVKTKASPDGKCTKAGLLKNSLAFAARVRTIIDTASSSPGPLRCDEVVAASMMTPRRNGGIPQTHKAGTWVTVRTDSRSC
jgi:hypothetical protein